MKTEANAVTVLDGTQEGSYQWVCCLFLPSISVTRMLNLVLFPSFYSTTEDLGACLCCVSVGMLLKYFFSNLSSNFED